MSEKSKTGGGKCVSENSTGGKSGVTRNSVNPEQPGTDQQKGHTHIHTHTDRQTNYLITH